MTTPPPPKASPLLRILLHGGFFVSGITTVIIGQVLPALMSGLQINDQQAGYFFVAQFSGSLTGTIFNNTIAKRFGFAGALLAGFFAMAAAMLCLNSGSFATCLAGFYLNGIGVGLTLPAVNLLTIELSPQNTASALNFLNFFWGFGAILCAPYVFGLSSGSNIFLPTVLLAAVLLLIGALIGGSAKSLRQSAPAETDSAPVSNIWKNPLAWMIALFNFFNVGFESATGGWLTTYSDRMGAPSHNWLSPIFLFFLWFVIGRAIAPITLRRLKENQLLMLSLIVTFAGAAGLFFANSYLVLCLAAAVTGLGTSSIFPTNMARFYSVFGAAATRQATPIFILGSIGANVISSSIGFISNQYQDLRWGMIVLPVSTALLIALQIAIMLRPPAKTP